MESTANNLLAWGQEMNIIKLDRLEGRSVFPGHFDNAIKILAGPHQMSVAAEPANASPTSEHAMLRYHNHLEEFSKTGSLDNYKMD